MQGTADLDPGHRANWTSTHRTSKTTGRRASCGIVEDNRLYPAARLPELAVGRRHMFRVWLRSDFPMRLARGLTSRWTCGVTAVSPWVARASISLIDDTRDAARAASEVGACPSPLRPEPIEENQVDQKE